MNAPWTQCTSVSNECLGGCRSMREHDAYRHATLTRERDEARAAFEACREQSIHNVNFANAQASRFQAMADEARADAARLREETRRRPWVDGKSILMGEHEADIAEIGWTHERIKEELAAQREACARVLEGNHRHDDGNCVDRHAAAERAGKTVVAVVGSACGNCNRAEAVRATPLVNGSDSRLAERDAATRDAALEEAAQVAYCWPATERDALTLREKVRALKRGGK